MRILISDSQLRERVAALAEGINSHYGAEPLIVIGALTGSLILLADLVRHLRMPLRLGLIQAKSYRGPATTPGELTLTHDSLPDVRGHRVLVVDDIFDTGRTLLALVEQIDDLGPISIKTLVLLKKQGRAEVLMRPDFVGFEIPDQFVVGYGMDYNDYYRHLPHVAVLEPADSPGAGPQ